MAATFSPVRGATITFTAAFTDQNGAPATPSSATVYLQFPDPSTGAPTKASLPMTVNGSQATAQWQSAAAGAGLVSWSIRALGANVIAQDGNFTLSANDANPAS